jgi:predicted alpha/beta superfamily hydrolase
MASRFIGGLFSSQIFLMHSNQSMFKHYIFALSANLKGNKFVIKTRNDHDKQ